MEALVVDRLSRSFGVGARRVDALREVSLTVADGEVVGLLGENGAGKTTLTKIAATVLAPTEGTVRVHGADVVTAPRAARRITSVVLGGDRGLEPRLSGRDNLRFLAMLRGATRRELAARADTALGEAGLGEVAGRAVETYSRGMRQRLHLAVGLFTRPRLLLLDEPTVGLDPVEAERLRSVITRLRTDGVAVLLSSHYLLDIERMADRVVLLHRGQVRGDLSVAEFARVGGYVSTVVICARKGRDTAVSDLAVSDGLLVDEVTWDGDVCTARLRVRDWRGESFSAITSVLGAAFGHMEILDVRVEPLRLEDVYTRLRGGGGGAPTRHP
jgi:ABC-2 type transport system ATP-binding protein